MKIFKFKGCLDGRCRQAFKNTPETTLKFDNNFVFFCRAAIGSIFEALIDDRQSESET